MLHSPDTPIRVAAEKALLDDKISELNDFFATPTFDQLDPGDANLLTMQRDAMLAYSGALQARLLRFLILNRPM